MQESSRILKAFKKNRSWIPSKTKVTEMRLSTTVYAKLKFQTKKAFVL